VSPSPALAAVAQEEPKLLCDAACAADIEARDMVTTPSGLQFRDIVVGTGPAAAVGFNETSGAG
jgi:peptidylprolyl isomerase